MTEKFLKRFVILTDCNSNDPAHLVAGRQQSWCQAWSLSSRFRIMWRQLRFQSLFKKPNNRNGVDEKDWKAGLMQKRMKDWGMKHNLKQSSSSCAAGVGVSRLVAECFLVASAVTVWGKKAFICFMCCFVHTTVRVQEKWRGVQLDTVCNRRPNEKSVHDRYQLFVLSL